MNPQENINELFLDNFNYKEKVDFIWKIINKIKIEDEDDMEINIFLGQNKKDQKNIYVKEIKFSFEAFNNGEIKKILKEIYFSIFLKKYKYFIKLHDMILFDESDTKKRVFLIFKGNNISLLDIINIYNKNEKEHNEKDKIIEDRDLLKFIIYQIAFALYSLHSNNIIHNNLKLENILINSNGIISISDFSSMSYKGEDSDLCTLSYSSPDFLNNILTIRDEKFDMWAFGVIILELFFKTNEYFKIDESLNKKEIGYKTKIFIQLKNILTKFGIKKNLTEEEINEIFANKCKENYKFQFTEEEKEKVNDENVLSLINNLLVLNPNKRFSAEQVIKSTYLREYSELFNFIDLPAFNGIDKNINYEKYYMNSFYEKIDNKKFDNIFQHLKLNLKKLIEIN